MTYRVFFQIILRNSIDGKGIYMTKIGRARSIIVLKNRSRVFRAYVFRSFDPLHEVRISKVRLVFRSPMPLLMDVVDRYNVAKGPLFVFETSEP